jgi:succinate dehydrogenase flavoprotein subunit
MHSSAERRLATSVLVIGTGGSGLRAAIQLAERGTDVLLVGKRPAADTHTTLAAGGINAALGTVDREDSWQQHAADTLKESYFLADPNTVRIVAEGAARAIADLERWGMPCPSPENRTAASRNGSSARTPSAEPPSQATTQGWRSSAPW